MNLHIALEANPNMGQDSAVYGEKYAFVLDGLGGTGGRTREHADGRKWKEAKIAANTAAQAVKEAVEANWANWNKLLGNASNAEVGLVTEQIQGELKWAIDGALQQAAREWRADTLPTTIAGWITFPQKDGNTLALAVWAGDSRCYTLDDACMKQCSADDVEEKYREDAMQELLGSGSSPMNNRIGINQAYHLNVLARRIGKRTLLMCCTDGIYGGMPSPMHLEFYLRLLSGAESFEEMAQIWSEVFEGCLQDDAATMELLLVDAQAADDEESRIKSMCEILAPAVDVLDEQYIKIFPEVIDEETVDVSGKIGSLAKQMCRQNFHNRLRKNAVEIVKKGKDFPNDLPCAGVLRQMQADYREMSAEKHIELVKKVQLAQRELDEYVAELDVGEVVPCRERLSLGKSVAGMVYSGQNSEFLAWIEERFNGIVRYMREWYAVGKGYSFRRMDERFNEKAITDLDEVMKDMCIFVNDHFNELPKTEGRKRLRLVYTGKEEICRRKGTLSREDQENLKMNVRSMVESGEIMEECLYAEKSWPVAVVANVVMLTQKLVQAEKELSRFDRSPSADGEPSTAALDDYLKSHPSSDARYFVADWVREKRKPSYFSLAEKDLLTISREIDALIQANADNEKLRQRYEERKQQIMDLWAQYKSGYEAWDEELEELVIEQPAAEASVETEAAVETEAEAPAAEAAVETEQEQPAVEEAAEAPSEEAEPAAEAPTKPEAEQPAAETEEAPSGNAAEDAEWTDCDSVEIHE